MILFCAVGGRVMRSNCLCCNGLTHTHTNHRYTDRQTIIPSAHAGEGTLAIRTSCKIFVPKSCHTFRLQESCLYMQESYMYWQESYLFFTLQESCKIMFQNQARILHVDQILARSWKDLGKILHKILARSWQNF